MGLIKRIALDPDLRRAFHGGRLSIRPSVAPTQWFFDRQPVLKAMDRATHRAMERGARNVRHTAQRSMRYVTDRRTQERQLAAGTRKRVTNYRPSRPGQPPVAVRPHPLVRRHLYYSYNRQVHNAVIGPVGFAAGSEAPHKLEFGGRVTIRNRRRRIRRLGDGGEIRLADGPVRYAQLRTARQVARSNRLNEQLYGPLERTIDLAPRPYMAPALKKESPSLPRLWHNSVKG